MRVILELGLRLALLHRPAVPVPICIACSAPAGVLHCPRVPPLNPGLLVCAGASAQLQLPQLLLCWHDVGGRGRCVNVSLLLRMLLLLLWVTMMAVDAIKVWAVEVLQRALRSWQRCRGTAGSAPGGELGLWLCSG